MWYYYSSCINSNVFHDQSWGRWPWIRAVCESVWGWPSTTAAWLHWRHSVGTPGTLVVLTATLLQTVPSLISTNLLWIFTRSGLSPFVNTVYPLNTSSHRSICWIVWEKETVILCGLAFALVYVELYDGKGIWKRLAILFHCFSVMSMAPGKRTDRIESQLKGWEVMFSWGLICW